MLILEIMEDLERKLVIRMRRIFWSLLVDEACESRGWDRRMADWHVRLCGDSGDAV